MNPDEFERRLARARREASLAEDPLTLPLRLRAVRRATLARRESAYKPILTKMHFHIGRASGRGKQTAKADARRGQIRTAISGYFRDYPKIRDKITAARLAEQLRAFQSTYFPCGIPYQSNSKFLREVRLLMAGIRPRGRPREL